MRLKTGCRFVDSHPKWVALQKLHITLVFLGDVTADRIPAIQDAMEFAARDTDPFELGVSGLGLFPPDSRAPKVLSADVTDKGKSLKRLYNDLAEELCRRNFHVQDRPFRPHLTLARLTSIKTSSRLGPLVASHASFLNAKFPVTEIVLFESVPIPDGTQYKALTKVGLGS